MICLKKLNKNDITNFLLAFCVTILVYNYKNIYKLQFCEMDSVEKINTDNKAIIKNLPLKIEKSKKRNSFISIGIPTVRRNNASYLKQTLDSLLYSMTNEEKKLVLIVVFIAEVNLINFT
jgi:hypothetical protein